MEIILHMIQMYSVLTTKYMHLSFQINSIKLTVQAGKEMLVDNLKPSYKSPTISKTLNREIQHDMNRKKPWI